MLTHARLLELLHYDAETGVFTWKVRPSRGVLAGSVAGGRDKKCGYWSINVDCRGMSAHRLAWFYAYAVWPAEQVDHINGDRADNRLANLREVCPRINSQNMRNAKSNNSSGYLGVTSRTRAAGRPQPFEAVLVIDGRQVRLGHFETPEFAHGAYLAAKRRLHEGCTI